jgi:hypothetical protein
MRYLNLFMILAFISIQAHARDVRNLAVNQPNSAGNLQRIALVIGNSNYHGTSLANPTNDARDMAAALRELGFDVTAKIDVTQKQMNRAIAQFGEKLNANTIALFYYAGHGMQVRGKNYLIPVDAAISAETSVRAETVDVDTVLDQLNHSPLSIVILDACRNNPFERRFRSIGGGLAAMDAPKGTLIAYATSPGSVASDGSGRNGLYTQELLRAMLTPGLQVESMFKEVRRNVTHASGDTQTPWEMSSLTGEFYFKPNTKGVSQSLNESTVLQRQQLKLPSDAEQKAMYCLTINRIEISFVHKFVMDERKKYNDPEAVRMLDSVTAESDDEINRLESFLLPRIPYLDPSAMQAAKSRADADHAIGILEANRCTERCNNTIDKTEMAKCIMKCSAENEVLSRMHKCSDKSYLPY